MQYSSNSNFAGAPQVTSGALLTTSSSSAKRAFNGPTGGEGSEATPTDEPLGAIRGAGMVYVRATYRWNNDNSWSGMSFYNYGAELWFYGVPSNQTGTKYFGFNWNGTHLSSVPVVVGQSYTLVAELNYNSDVTRLWVDPATGSDTPAVVWPMTSGSWCTAVRCGSGGQTLWDDLIVATHWSELGLAPKTGLILYEGFEGYSSTTNLPTQTIQGTGFRMGSRWFGSSTDDSKVVTNNLVYPHLVVSDAAAMCTTKGAGSTGTHAYLDLGTFDRAALLGSDTYKGTANSDSLFVGGADVEGTLYYSFLARSNSGLKINAYAGFQLWRDETEVCLVGNLFSRSAFSARADITDFDLNSANSDRANDNFEEIDTDTHLFVVKIDYHANANDDITIWLDPNVKLLESEQDPATKTLRTNIGNLSFNNIHMRGGNGDNSWSYDEIRFGTDWRTVLPKVEYPEGTIIMVR